MIDPSELLNETFTDANSTELIPIPENLNEDPYQGVAKKLEIKTGPMTTDPSRSWMKLSITWEIQDEDVKEFVQRDNPTVRQDLFLDTADGGGLDMGRGKNIGLGKLREALNMNKEGEPFGLSMIEGQYAGILVEHEEYTPDGEDEPLYIPKVKRIVAI